MCWVVCAGMVSTLAGSGSSTWADGLGNAASFNGPAGVSVDSNGAVYVADYNNNRIRMVSSSGVWLDALYSSLAASVSVGCPQWKMAGGGSGGISAMVCRVDELVFVMWFYCSCL